MALKMGTPVLLYYFGKNSADLRDVSKYNFSVALQCFLRHRGDDKDKINKKFQPKKE